MVLVYNGRRFIINGFNRKPMKDYELRQAILDKMEIEELVAKIQRLEKTIAENEFELANIRKLVGKHSNDTELGMLFRIKYRL